MSTIRTFVAALAVASAVVLPATGAVAAVSGSQTRTAYRSDASPAALATAPVQQSRVSIVDLVDIFLYCDDAAYDTMYPPGPFFVSDCMRGGAPASNG